MSIKESAENYLETILILKNKTGNVRSVDIANALSYTKPSVSVAMKKLREENYITVDTTGNINLTKKGLDIANKMYERHSIIAKALIAIGVDEESALLDSCKIEHVISEKSFNCIKNFLKNKSRHNAVSLFNFK